MRNRPRFAEKVAAGSALALFGVLFLDWFALDLGPLVTGGDGEPASVTVYAAGGASGWDSLGWFALALCVLSIAAGIAVAVLFTTQVSPVLPQLASACALVLGTLTVIALLVQVVFQPGPDELVTVQAGWWLGLLAAAGVARGGFLSMHDEYLAGVPIPDVPVRPAPVA